MSAETTQREKVVSLELDVENTELLQTAARYLATVHPKYNNKSDVAAYDLRNLSRSGAPAILEVTELTRRFIHCDIPNHPQKPEYARWIR